jgi:hypothetical protein
MAEEESFSEFEDGTVGDSESYGTVGDSYGTVGDSDSYYYGEDSPA